VKKELIKILEKVWTRFEQMKVYEMNICASQITHLYIYEKKKNQREEMPKSQPVKNRGQTLFQPVKQTKGQLCIEASLGR